MNYILSELCLKSCYIVNKNRVAILTNELIPNNKDIYNEDNSSKIAVFFFFRCYLDSQLISKRGQQNRAYLRIIYSSPYSLIQDDSKILISFEMFKKKLI